MRSNLRVSSYNDSSTIPTGYTNEEWDILNTDAYAYVNDNNNNSPIYGYLYNGYAIADDRGICPENFHIPSDEDFMELELFIGMTVL